MSILIEKCVIFLQSLTSLDKFFFKALIDRFKTRGKRAQNTKWRGTRVLFFSACADKMPMCLVLVVAVAEVAWKFRVVHKCKTRANNI